MFKSIEHEFYKAFDIVPTIRDWCQFNYAQVPRGQMIFKQRQELEERGEIVIKCKKLTPSKDNDCVYWEEWSYVNTDYARMCKLMCLHNRVCSNHKFDVSSISDLQSDILRKVIDDLAELMKQQDKNDIELYRDVRLLYGCPVEEDTRKDLDIYGIGEGLQKYCR